MENFSKEILFKSIATLMLEHNCVIVPGLGGFLSVEKNSSLNTAHHTAYPACKNVSFNAQLQLNDGLLINDVAYKLLVNYNTAETLVKDWVNEVKISLQNNNTIRLEGIGKLQLNDEGNIIFTASVFNELNLNAFGLKPIALPENKIETTNENLVEILVEESVNIQPKKNNKKHFTTYALAAIAVAFLVVSQILYFNAKENNLPIQQLSIANVFNAVKHQNKVTVEKPIITTQQNLINILKEEENRPSINEHITQIENKEIEKGYYIITGSFKNYDNANNALTRISKENLKANIIPSEEGNYRVGIYVSEKVSDVRTSIKTFRAKYNKQAWVMLNS